MGILLKLSKYTMVAARRVHLDRRIPDKASLDRKVALAKLQKTFSNNYFYEGWEWPYKDVEKCVFVEQYIEEANGQLNDYKIFCFDSEPRLIQLDYDRFKGYLRNLYTPRSGSASTRIFAVPQTLTGTFPRLNSSGRCWTSAASSRKAFRM